VPSGDTLGWKDVDEIEAVPLDHLHPSDFDLAFEYEARIDEGVELTVLSA